MILKSFVPTIGDLPGQLLHQPEAQHSGEAHGSCRVLLYSKSHQRTRRKALSYTAKARIMKFRLMVVLSVHVVDALALLWEDGPLVDSSSCSLVLWCCTNVSWACCSLVRKPGIPTFASYGTLFRVPLPLLVPMSWRA